MNKLVLAGIGALVLVVAVIALVSISNVQNTGSVTPEVPEQTTNQNTQAPEGVPGGTIITPFGPMALPTSDVQGSDIDCVGRYSGMIRVMYDNYTEPDGYYDLSVIYYISGNVFEQVKQYFTNKILECGYEKQSESNIAPPLQTPTISLEKYSTIEYYKGDSISLTFTVVLLKYNGQYYTFVQLEKTQQPSGYEFTEEYNQTEQSMQEEPQEVTPTGKAAVLDSFIKPVLQNIFGSAVLTDYSVYTMGATYISLKYTLGREVTSDDVNALAGQLNLSGYSTLASEVTDAYFSLTLSKDQNMLTITGDMNTRYITVEQIEQ